MTTTNATRTVNEEMTYQALRDAVNTKAYAEGRITDAQFLQTRTKIRDRMDALSILLS